MSKFRFGFAAAVLAAVTAFSSSAIGSTTLTLCAKKDGKIRLVSSSADCKKDEQAVTFNEGARDVGSVQFTANGTPAFVPEGLRGWQSINRSSDPFAGFGTYCLAPDSSVTLDNSVLVLSLGSPGAGAPGSVVWEGYCSISPLQYRVSTFDQSGDLAGDITFTAIVP
jgi:hypothetical protein